MSLKFLGSIDAPQGQGVDERGDSPRSIRSDDSDSAGPPPPMMPVPPPPKRMSMSVGQWYNSDSGFFRFMREDI